MQQVAAEHGASQDAASGSRAGSQAWGARSVDVFQKIEQIGEGQYGLVWLARDRDGSLVALKKVKMDNEKEGFPITAIREIKILKNLKHPNIVRLREIVTSRGHDHNKQKGNVYMVFEYAEHDLAGLILNHRNRLEKPHVKSYLKQLLEGLHYLHKQKILHRDIKGANLLITNGGRLKIADFGLARSYNDPSVPLTKKVITLWYRPPEVLLESEKYGAPADMWSVGCIFAELLFKLSINQFRNIWSLPGIEGPHNESQQIAKIFEICGTPTTEGWPSWLKLPGARNMRWKPRDSQLKDLMRAHCTGITDDELDLLDKFLTCNPDKRITAHDALRHEFLWKDPLPAKLEDMPKIMEANHEWQVKKKRQLEKQKLQQQNAQQGGGRPAQPPPPQNMHPRPPAGGEPPAKTIRTQ